MYCIYLKNAKNAMLNLPNTPQKNVWECRVELLQYVLTCAQSSRRKRNVDAERGRNYPRQLQRKPN